jgi:hypothetical protein
MRQIVKIDVVALYNELWAIGVPAINDVLEAVDASIKHTCKATGGKKHRHTCTHCKARWLHNDGSYGCAVCHMCPKCGALHDGQKDGRR